jgi:hypothetical protein
MAIYSSTATITATKEKPDKKGKYFFIIPIIKGTGL